MISTGKQMIYDALNHVPGEVPIDFGANPVTGIHVRTIYEIRKYLGLADEPVKLIDPFQMLGRIEDDLKDVLGIATTDIAGQNNLFGFRIAGWKEWRSPWGQLLLVPGDFKTSVSPEGTIFLYPQGDNSVPPSGRLPKEGFYFDTIVRQHPIDDERLDPSDNLEEFPLLTDTDIDHFRKEAVRLHGSSRFVFGSLTGDTGLGDIARVPAPMLKDPKGIRDEAEWYISTVSRQDYLREVFNEQTDRAIINLSRIHSVTGDLIGAVFICGTDFGTQNSLFCSQKTFKELYHPYYKKVNDWIHANTKWKTFKHSCGAVVPLIPSFIEAGFDIINPVQISAEGMDPSILKRKFGSSLTFWGGGVDTQKTLPFGTKADVRREVLSNLKIFASGGGFVFNAVHNVQAQVPAENFVAMVNAVHEFNGNPLIKQ